MHSTFLAGAVALASAVAAFPAGATTYHLVDLGKSSQALAINHKGEVAGDAPSGPAAIYVHGEWRTKHDRHHGSLASAIDDEGNAVGQEWDGHRVAYLMYYPRGAKNYGIPMPGGAS